MTEKSNGKEVLITKIYSYQATTISKNENPTLEGLKEYLKDDNEIEYIQLYVETASLSQVQVGQNATHAKVKLKAYKYEYILNRNLQVMDNEGETLPEDIPTSIRNVEIDSELQTLLSEANMQITIQDILNTPKVLDNITGLIPTVTQEEVTRSEADGIITYTNKSNGEIIRINSEYLDDSRWSWFAFDGNNNTYSAPLNISITSDSLLYA